MFRVQGLGLAGSGVPEGPWDFLTLCNWGYNHTSVLRDLYKAI